MHSAGGYTRNHSQLRRFSRAGPRWYPQLDIPGVAAYQRPCRTSHAATGDLDLRQGRGRLVTGAEFDAQSCACHATLFKGECFRDTRASTYKNEVLVKSRRLDVVHLCEVFARMKCRHCDASPALVSIMDEMISPCDVCGAKTSTWSAELAP